MDTSSRVLGYALIGLFLFTVVIWSAAFAEDRGGRVTVTFLNVGQGDAIFIDAPSGRQVLIDGGPDTSVVRELSQVMPWYDRTIDMVIGTHPDADHIGGLLDVLPRYRIGTIVQSSVEGSTDTWRTFEKEIVEEHAAVYAAERGQVFDLGKAATLEILFPDRSVAHVETNVGCVVARLTYGTTAFMLPCDTSAAIERYLVHLDGEALHADVLKAAHHGSKTSSSMPFVAAVAPSYAVYSRGCGNSYGHPNAETIATFARFEIPTLDTCTDGRITFVSDGQTVERE